MRELPVFCARSARDNGHSAMNPVTNRNRLRPVEGLSRSTNPKEPRKNLLDNNAIQLQALPQVKPPCLVA